MGLIGRLSVLLPLALSIVGIVLSALCLFAGRDTGFMEDYDILRLNTSKIGQDVIPWDEISLTDVIDNFKRDSPSDIVDGLQDSWEDTKEDIKGTIEDVEDNVTGKVDEVTNEIAEEISERLGISHWYSIHVMSACHGYWEPNATAHDPALNVSGCSTDSPTYRLNLTEMIDQEINVGALGISLADIEWPPELQEKIDLINDLLLAIFIVYVIGMGFCGLAVIGCAVSLILASSRLMTIINFAFAGLGALALTIGSIVITVAGTVGIDEVNKVGEDINVRAHRGEKFLIISWVAAACMILAAAFWTTRFCILCVQKRREKKVPRKGSY